MAIGRVTWPDARVMADGRVRIPATATVVNVAGTDYYQWEAGSRWEVELIPDTDPTWQPGDVARDANGVVFVRTESGRWRDALGQNLEPVRPMTRLVPAP